MPYDYQKKYQCGPDIWSNHCTKLMYLIIKQKPIKRYLTKYPNEINKQNKKGYTALMIAAVFSRNKYHEKAVKQLINVSAKMNLINKNGFTALMLACQYTNKYSSIETVHYLLEGDDFYDEDMSSTPLLLACGDRGTNSTLETVELLLEYVSDIDCGGSPLITAISTKIPYQFEVVKLLLEAGANVNYGRFCWRNETPLIAALENKKVDKRIIPLLLEYNADMECLNRHPYCMRSFTTRPDRKRLAHLFIKYGYNLDNIKFKDVWEYFWKYQKTINPN